MKVTFGAHQKKILHIGQDTGGIKTYMVQVFDHCSIKDYQFLVIAPANEYFEDYCREKSIRYYRVNLLRGGGALSRIAALASIIRVIIREKPNIIHTHSAIGGFLGRLAGRLTGSKNIIYTPHAFSYLSFTGIKRMIFYGLEILARSWTSVLLAISHSEADKAIYELGYKRSVVKTIPNSISLPAGLVRKQFGPIINIRMIGRLTIQKNPMLFLEIAKEICSKYDNVRFSLLGAGIHDYLSKEINDYIENNVLSEKVQIDKWADDLKSRSFLREADIFLMTSIFEGLSYSLLEAMSLGKPCIVSDVDGNKDVVRNGENGYSCVTKDDFCQKIELLILNEDLKNKIGAAAFNYVQLHHNISINILKLEALYNELCESPL